MRLSAAALVLLLLTPPRIAAAAFTLDLDCQDLRLVKRGNDLAVVCAPGVTLATIKDLFRICANGVRASRQGEQVWIRCR